MGMERKLALMVGLAVCFFGWMAEGQVQRVSHERGNGYDGVLQNLVDSQLNFNTRAPLPGSASGAGSAELQQARQLIAAFANDAARLISALTIEQRYSENVRMLLGDVLQLKANADVLVRRSQVMTSLQQFADEYAAIDRQWRPLANQLKQLPNVGTRVTEEVDRLNNTSRQITRNLQLDPQLQRGELNYQFAAMQADLRHLAEDIQIDLAADAKSADLINHVRNLQSRASQVSMAVEAGYAYRDIKQYYQQFFEQWMATKRMLRGVDNQYIQRSITRISHTHDRIHELLWLPPVIDGADILFMADSLKASVDRVCDQITLTQLIALPNSKQIYERAAEFHRMCHTFRENVAKSTELDSVRWDFGELDVAWNSLRNLIAPLNNPRAMRHVAMIDSSVMELRDILGQRATINQNEVMQIVSTLDNMTELLHFDLNRYVGQSDRYPAAFRSQAVNSANSMQRTARSLYQSVMQNANTTQIRQQTTELSRQWKELQQHLGRIPENDRAQIARTTQHIGPALAKLQVMYY